MSIRFNRSIAIVAMIAAFASCKKTETETVYQPYTIPSKYNFDNVEYKEAAARISMWQGYQAYLGKSTTRVLSQDTVNYLWNNTNAAFTAELASGIPYTYDVLNTLTTLKLSDKSAGPALLKALADSMVKVSAFNTQAASNGVPGKIGTRLFNHTGLEFNQAVAKGLMGSMSLYNIISLLDKVPTEDNNTVVAGQGTAMQHTWDLAFGYIGVPKNYDTSIAYTVATIDRPLAIGGYFAERGKYIKAGGTVFEAFLKGRAAIGAKDYATRDAAIVTIKLYIEKTIAAAAYYYATAAQTQTALDAKFHGLSEAYGFVVALKYRAATSPLTATNYQALVDIMQTSFWDLAADASNTKLKQVQTIFTTAYGQLQP